MESRSFGHPVNVAGVFSVVCSEVCCGIGEGTMAWSGSSDGMDVVSGASSLMLTCDDLNGHMVKVVS